MNKFLAPINVALIIACSLALGGCEPGFESVDDGDDDDTGVHYVGNNGSLWQLEIDDDDFDLQLRPRPSGTKTVTAKGDYEELSSGFSRFTITSADGSEAPADGTLMQALLLKENLLLLDDWINPGQLMPLIRDDDCPESDFTANWLRLRAPSGNLANSPQEAYFGELAYSRDDARVTFNSAHALTDEYPSPDTALEAIETGDCSAGYASRGDHKLLFADNGSLLIHHSNESIEETLWLALPASPLTNADLDGSYIGFWIDNTLTVNARLGAVTMECTDGDCPVERITDITNLSSTANQSFQITLDIDSLDDAEKPGFVTGTVETVSSLGVVGRGNLSCIASDDFNDTGSKLLACVGQSPSNPQITTYGYFIAQG